MALVPAEETASPFHSSQKKSSDLSSGSGSLPGLKTSGPRNLGPCPKGVLITQSHKKTKDVTGDNTTELSLRPEEEAVKAPQAEMTTLGNTARYCLRGQEEVQAGAGGRSQGEEPDLTM